MAPAGLQMVRRHGDGQHPAGPYGPGELLATRRGVMSPVWGNGIEGRVQAPNHHCQHGD